MSQPNFQTFIVDTEQLLYSLKTYAENVESDFLAYDVETDGKNEKTANLYGIGMAFTESKAFYLPWRKPTGEYFWSDIIRADIIHWLRELLSTRKLIGHNIIYDTLITEHNLGIVLDSYIHADTILMKHTLEEEPPFALKEIAVTVLGAWADKAQDKLEQEVKNLGGSWTKDAKDMYLASTATLGEYCCWDVILTIMLFKEYDARLAKENLTNFFYEEEVMPLYKEVTINMKRKGFPIDIAYYEDLKQEISKEIKNLESSIYSSIKKDIAGFENKLLEEEFPVKTTGNFPKVVAELLNVPLPLNKKTGEVTLARKAVEAQRKGAGGYKVFYDWLLEENNIDINSPTFKILYTKTGDIVKDTQMKLWKEKFDTDTVFNLKSNDHLIELLVNTWGFQPLERTEKTNKPKIDDDFIESLKGNPVADKLKDYKKLNKLLSTYVEGILDRQIDGYIFTSMLQFGTTSGRYSSRDPNLQNQPRIKDDDSGLSQLVLQYVNAIRKGFVAGPGRKVVNADYSSLEPVCFAHVSGDEKLRNIFRNGEDLYSRIAIETFGLNQYSAIKKDPMYLKLHKPEIRQTSKVFCLAVPYGAEASRISDELKVTYKEADDIIRRYLNGFPNLSRYMNRCNYEAKTKGFVKTELGRVRHLKEARSIYTLYGDQIIDYKYAKKNGLTDVRRKFKTCLNNAKNFPIQGLAAHIVNRAMIQIAREFKKQNIDGWIALQVHDEITCIINELQADLAAKIIKNCMENTTKISVPLNADPMIADNWGEAK
jgi:DNA polymerase I-like protein with 3'-5' exonuclease and polymerase domains